MTTTDEEISTLSKLISSCPAPAVVGLFSADGNCHFHRGSNGFSSSTIKESSGFDVEQQRHIKHVFSQIAVPGNFWDEKLSLVKEQRRPVYIEHPRQNTRVIVVLFPYHPEPGLLDKLLIGSIAVEVPNSASYQSSANPAVPTAVSERMLGIIGHELRNPLAAIGAGITIIGIRIPDFPHPHILHYMKRQIQLASRLVDDLVDSSLLTNGGKLPLIMRKEYLSEVINMTLEGFKLRSSDKKKHSLSVSIPEIPIVINCDLFRLSQAISNLLHNASKYTPDGGRIELCVSSSQAEISIAVSDNGVGIPADKLESIFEPFMQLEQSHSQTEGGVGLGLFLVQSIIEGHNGKIYASSDGTGRGSVFEIRIPVTPDA